MPEWTICPHCSLKHGRRPDGNCPRCKQPALKDGRSFPETTHARETAVVAESEWKRSTRRGGTIGWIMRHPPAGSVLCLFLALGTLYHGLADAKAYQRFGKASPVAAKVASLSKISSFPPRWNAEVTWHAFGTRHSATLLVGTRGKSLNTPDLSVGAAVEILIAADNPADAMLSGRLPAAPLRLLGLEIHPAGLGFTVFGVVGAVLLFVYADKIRRDATAVSPSPTEDSTEAPSAPVPDSGRGILALAAGGLVLLVAGFVAAPRVRDALSPRTVWAINGLDVPLEVTVAGKRMQVPAHGHASVKTAANELVFVATTQSGLEVDRATFRPASRGSNVAFNLLGAATLYVHSLVYAREGRQGPFAGDGRPNEEIEARQVLERTDIDFFLDPAPQTIQLETREGGVEDRRELVVGGDWRTTVRSLARSGRVPQALKLAQAVAAAEPNEPDPKDAVRALTLRPREMETPAEPAPHPGESFLAVSADRRARAEQTPTGEGQCTVRCEVSGQVVWTVNECLSKAGEQRFTTPDCERLMVVRSFGEASAVWRQSPVVFIYHRGQSERHIPAGDFISQDAGVHPMETYFLWMKGIARLSADGAAVEFETRDGRPQRVPFAPDGRQ